MKQKLFILFAMLALIGFSTTAKAEDDTYTDSEGVTWINVSTADMFYSKIKANHSANIRLTADIDISGLKADGDYIFDFTFSGKIDATADSVTVDSNGRLRNFGVLNCKHMLFSKLSHATIQHFCIMDCSYDGLDTGSAQLARDAVNNTVLDDVVFSGVTATGDVTGYDCDYMAAAIAHAENCTFKNLMFLDCKLITDGSYMGMVAGEATGCTFINCVANAGCEMFADGNLTSNNSAYIGGICGCANNCKFQKCFNFSTVESDDDRIGGIIGYGGSNTTLTDCKNGGVIRHCIRDGFGRAVYPDVSIGFAVAGVAFTVMAGLSYYLMSAGAAAWYNAPGDHWNYNLPYWQRLGIAVGMKSWNPALNMLPILSINGVITAGAMAAVASMPYIFLGIAAACFTVSAGLAIYSIAANPDEMGGIAGTVEGGCTLLRCTNAGPLECSDDYCGGIVGYLDGSTINSCYNRTFVRGGGSHVGGIVGYCNNGTIKNNLNVGPTTAGGSHVGQIEGLTEGSNTREHNYYLAEDNTTNGPSYAFTQEKLPSGEIAKTLNDILSEPAWRQKQGDFYPVLDDTTKTYVTKVFDSYTIEQNIGSSSDFYLSVANPNAHINITQNIDLQNFYFNLASSEYPFKGIINGNGYTLSNCSYQMSDDNQDHNYALFPYTKNATFKDFTLDNIKITQEDEVDGDINTVGILAGTSNNCKFKNITLKNSSISINDDIDYLSKVGGLVAISNNDSIVGCTAESTCRFTGYTGWFGASEANVGGIAAMAYGSYFGLCHNAAEIWADDDNDAGIVAYAENCTIDGCLNTGHIKAQEYVGGICGRAKKTIFKKCVNTGTIDDDENTREDYRAGIVGCLEGSGASISSCLNFGSVNYADDYCGALEGTTKDGATSAYQTNSFYYCQFNGKHADNEKEYTADNTLFRYTKMQSGEFALNATDSEGKKWLYQSIDNDNGFPTNLPVPVAAAGVVYSNILCDGTQSYSNIYQSTVAHTGEANEYGRCTTCGNIIGDIAKTIHITNATELNFLAKTVNNGGDFSNSNIYLDNDIDMSGCSYTPIGNATYPFNGDFDGQGHRIKNLSVDGTNTAVGVFGNVSGGYIENVVVDKSCTFTNKTLGTAGLVGAVSDATNATHYVSIINCGNEATVYSTGKNSGGIIGVVYGSDKFQINVINCYNTGSITGSDDCASIVGYTNTFIGIKNVWNTGSVTGNRSSYPFAGTWDKTRGTIENCYDVNSQSGINTLSTTDVQIGAFCKQLNVNRAALNSSAFGTPYYAWGQNVGNDSYPTFSNDGIHHTRTMKNQWATICLPYEVTSSDDYDFYQLTQVDAEEISLQKVTGTIAAGTPLVIRRDANVTSVDVPADSETSFASAPVTGSYANGLTLTGAYTQTDVTDKDGYIISGGQFWKIADIKGDNKVACGAFRAYLAGTLTDGSDAKCLSINISDDESTALSALNAITSGTAEYYDLNGRRLNDLQKGINIVRYGNGVTKKVIIK